MPTSSTGKARSGTQPPKQNEQLIPATGDVLMVKKSETTFKLLSIVFFCVAFVLTVLTGGLVLAASCENPQCQVEREVHRILAVLQDDALRQPGQKQIRRERVIAVIDSFFEFREMARSALAKHWDARSPAERDHFVELFSRLVKHRYIGKIDAYDGQQVFFKKELVRDDKAMVYSILLHNNTEIPITYKMLRAVGKWLVYDLTIENVSLALNYRRDFDSVINREKYEGLIEKLESQLQEIEEKQ